MYNVINIRPGRLYSVTTKLIGFLIHLLFFDILLLSAFLKIINFMNPINFKRRLVMKANDDFI
jgi:hypothetical protein